MYSMFTFIARFFGWLLNTRRRVLAIRDGATLSARHHVAQAAESLPLPDYFFTDDQSDADDDPGSDPGDPCGAPVPSAKLSSNTHNNAKGNSSFGWLRAKCREWGLKRPKRFEECCVCHEDRSKMVSVCPNGNEKAPHEACLKCIKHMKQWGIQTCHMCRQPVQYQNRKIRRC